METAVRFNTSLSGGRNHYTDTQATSEAYTVFHAASHCERSAA